MTIASSRCEDTEALFHGQRVARLRSVEAGATRKLAMLSRGVRVEELRVPPNHRREALKGDRRGRWSIHVIDPWRVCFRFADGRATGVETFDYR